MNQEAQHSWLTALKRYFCVLLAGNLVWEFVQLPLYTLWDEGPWKRVVFAAVHCTGGDLLIGGSALMIALLFVGDGSLAARKFRTGGRCRWGRWARLHGV